MAEVKPGGRAGGIRRVVLAVVLAGIAFLVWRQVTRREGYTGGDVVTTGTVQAVHVDLAFKVPGRIADVPVAEGDDVQAGQLGGTLETQGRARGRTCRHRVPRLAPGHAPRGLHRR